MDYNPSISMTHYDLVTGRVIEKPIYSRKFDIKIGQSKTISDLFDDSGNLIPKSKRRELYIKKGE